MLKLSLVKYQCCSTVLYQRELLNKILRYSIQQWIAVVQFEEMEAWTSVLVLSAERCFFTREILEERSFTNSTNLGFIIHTFIKNHTNISGRVWGADRIIGNENKDKPLPRTTMGAEKEEFCHIWVLVELRTSVMQASNLIAVKWAGRFESKDK